ncbi:hypothetical protein [Herbiconiux sp. VKM Ac-2851]|uniref:hypothetical protein n=1 Tax=Herbiconiux sp. VKM Ac-2851 TaxID=2739025 RepID=UPI0015665BD4|nr:hypothetical protein [Herbiconiux sp. VKM Ac-2851]NQX36282.1 hypothetical protein [Herbiconiux sp. VKM Ac-2851]
MSDPIYSRPKIRQLLAERLTPAEVAGRVGCSVRTVERVRADDLGEPAPKRRFTADEIAFMGRLFEDGCTLSEVARTLHTSTDRVLDHFPNAPRADQATAAEMRALRARLDAIPIRRYGHTARLAS